MKNKYCLSNIRKIRESYKRFLSLMCLSFLGVGFFAGIKTTEPNFIKTLDKYYDNQNLYDLEIVSTKGFNEENINNLKNIKEFELVVGTKTKDIEIEINKKKKVLKLFELKDNINIIEKIEGRLPENEREIAVEKKFLIDNKLKINDNIEIENKKMKIVAIINSPYYITDERGTSSVGNGSVDYYAYTNELYFNYDYYTDIYITVKKAKELETSKNNYTKLMKKAVNQLNKIVEQQEEIRFKEIYLETLQMSEHYNLDLSTLELEEVKWYVRKRNDNQGYQDFIDASSNIKNIGNVFPILFYAVSVLISLITMLRMIEEDRNQIGTLKSLGFNNAQITTRYILYAFIPTLIGGLIGSYIGITIIPNIIWDIYNNTMFNVPNFVNYYNLYYTVIGILISLICVLLVTYYISIKNLKQSPASLMREKAPKIGKRIFLEKIKPFWNSLNFSNKITLRNLFRYKSRMLVSLIGIGGSTALVLVGFGLKDSIKDVANIQYSEIFKYDVTMTFRIEDTLKNTFDNYQEIIDYSIIRLEKVETNNKKNTLVMYTLNDDYQNLINLVDFKTKEILKLKDDKVIITQKYAKINNLTVGDTITINNIKLKISAIAKNNIGDYAYINKKTYEKYYGNYKSNIAIVKMDNKIKSKLLKEDNITSIKNSSDTYKLVNKSLNSLNSVVYILIISAALLALVIMYNLSNINISERKREIATLKVLGFNEKEVDSYINKESNILTVLGIIIGLIGGQYLTFYVISTCEPSMLLFQRSVTMKSYITTALIIFLFMMGVHIMIHIYLKKIDMIESLKNRE